jgi:hypothetical protein
MAQDTPSRKANQDMPNPDQPKLPKYEYQIDDTRSFSVGYGMPPKRDSKPADQCENKSTLKVF